MDERIEHGLNVFSELMGADRAAGMRGALTNTSQFGAPIARLATEYAFGAVWSRDGLQRSQRSLVTLGILIASRQTQELKNHVRIAIKNGLTVRELEEVLVQSIPYVGFPAVASASTAVIETLREMGLDLKTRTAEENGLL